MSKFTIYPAIDMKGGRVVRLLKGDMAQATEYGDDPLAQAKIFHQAGADWLHLVNLDAAVGNSNNKNLAIIEKIADWKKTESHNIKLQMGGGIRTADDAIFWLNHVDRIIVGTLAVEQPAVLQKLIRQYPNKIAIAIDCHNGMVATRGWVVESTITAIDFASQFADLPTAGFIHTDIARDGTGDGANWQESEKLQQKLQAGVDEKKSQIPVIVSGGIDNLDEIKSIKAKEIFGGVIVGRAIYENKIDLKELFSLQQL